MRIRIRETAAVVYEDEFRRIFSDTSFPETITPDILDAFGADPVLEGAQPTLGPDQYSAYVGVVEIDGVWFTAYEARDYTPEEIAQRLDAWRQAAVVSPFQGRASLLHANLLDEVETMMANAATPRQIKLAWEYATEWRRLSPMLIAMAQQLQLTDEQVDDLIRYAQTVEV